MRLLFSYASWSSYMICHDLIIMVIDAVWPVSLVAREMTWITTHSLLAHVVNVHRAVNETRHTR